MTTNPQRGEVTITLPSRDDGGADRHYTLKLSMNAAAVLEGRLKKKIGEVLLDATSLSFTSIRDMVWLLLQKHHAAEFPSGEKGLIAAGNLIDDAGGVHAFFETLRKLGAVNEPEQGDQVEGDGENPQTAPGAGTGDASTSKRDRLM